MIKRKMVRNILGIFLGGAAGLSLTSSVLPTAFSTTGLVDMLFVRWTISEYAAHAVLVWAVGGWVVARMGIPKAGALVLGLLGLVSGVLLTVAGLGTQMQIMLVGGAAGGVYGLLGGLLLGNILQGDGGRPPVEA